ncbi:NAD(P)-dependent malic enzyme [Methanolobus profundi]|uniref:Malate dehydrogenase (Oxaloacetate-decarboxylating) n=1 Tax=Methanolobus profundi TaxID=487685 RepID=A0A1I4PIP4_9EURY|nr:NADP-dependent malic enzyme [Methanolobus profundi]SFM27514.1 malate dehydrogenase (oxaloacetate-decarboxylating) [Methanolobus profundi]
MKMDKGISMCKEGDNTLGERSLELHESAGGVIGICGKVPLDNVEDLSLAYTPGVAEPCRRIAEDPDQVYRYTMKKNSVAVISDGSAVLGLGNIGPLAALPVMEGKALIFKELAGIDGVPICLDTNDQEEIIRTIRNIAPVFGGINLEDISAPRCFDIEGRLRSELPIPVFHDDQHGTAVVVIAGLINALKIVGKEIDKIDVVISGAGAAGKAIALKLMYAGVSSERLVVCDSRGIIHKGRKEGMNPEKEEIADLTNKKGISGTLADALIGSDVFIGVSAPGIVSKEMASSMAKDAIIFAMANPVPEIMPSLAKEAGARIVATGRSDCPNQINNCLGFPGLFRGALDTCASDITTEMEMAAVYALASIVTDEELDENYIIPGPLDRRVVKAVASAVAAAAIKSGVARSCEFDQDPTV